MSISAASQATESNSINIYIDSTTIRDPNDECMSKIIETFAIKANRLMPSQQEIVFKIKNLDDFTVKYISKGDIAINVDKEFLLTACAIDSILQKLFTLKCITNEVVNFQARKRGHILSGNFSIFCTPKADRNRPWVLFSGGTISHTYAYLESHELCLFLNPISNEKLDKIRNALKIFFPESNESIATV